MTAKQKDHGIKSTAMFFILLQPFFDFIASVGVANALFTQTERANTHCDFQWLLLLSADRQNLVFDTDCMNYGAMEQISELYNPFNSSNGIAPQKQRHLILRGCVTPDLGLHCVPSIRPVHFRLLRG